MDGIVRILKSNKPFYDGTATECPAVTLNDLLTEGDPVIPFLESVASHEVDPRDLANLRKQFDDVSKMVARACDRLYERFRLGTANKFKSDFRTFFSDCLVPGAPEGWSRSAWICSRGFNAMFSWIHLCYGVELREEDCLRTAIAVPGFRIETAGERISRMKAHDAWDWQFRSTVPNITNCATFFLDLTLQLHYLVDDSPKYFVYDLKEKKGSCEEEVSYALRASMDHAPFDKYMAAEASHWIRLARIRMITALANSFVYRCQDDKDDQQAFDLWQELISMIVLQDTKLKLDFEPDEVSLIIRLADLAAERAHDYWKDKRQYDNVLPLAKMSPTDKPGVDLCDLRPLDNHPFKWRGPIVAWYGRLKRGYEAKADSKSILDIIDNTTFAALEYYRVLTIGAPYLRGEADRKPEPFTGKDGEVREFERILTSSVERVLLKPMAAIIEQLPSLNTAVAGYPIERLEDLFKALNLFATAMNHCEEEKTSAEGLGLGQAVVETLLLGRLVCPKKNAQGRYVLERSLIAEKFRDFHKSIRLAACCIKRKAEKRAGGKIELGDLEDGEKKGLGIGDQGLGSGEIDGARAQGASKPKEKPKPDFKKRIDEANAEITVRLKQTLKQMTAGDRFTTEEVGAFMRMGVAEVQGLLEDKLMPVLLEATKAIDDGIIDEVDDYDQSEPWCVLEDICETWLTRIGQEQFVPNAKEKIEELSQSLACGKMWYDIDLGKPIRVPDQFLEVWNMIDPENLKKDKGQGSERKDSDDTPESVELSPELADLFRRGTELTREILRRVNACEAVYLGKSKKPPKYLLSATFDSKTGPSLPYFAETIHVIRNEIADRRPRHGEGLETFERECQVTLEALRLFFVRLSVYLEPACGEKLKKSLYVFRVAEGRFFKQLREGCTLIGSVFESIVSEGVGLNTASVYLDQMADALREREGQLGIGDSGVGIRDPELMPKVEDLTRVVKEGFEEIKGEFATAHKEHQKIDKEVVGTRRGLGAVLRHVADWKNIVREMLSKRKIPWGKVEKAAGEDRYGKVDWSKIKHKDGIQQIKDVIDYTYDVKPVTLGVSKNTTIP